MPPSGIRPFRTGDTISSRGSELSVESERVPFLTQEQTFINSPHLEDGAFTGSSTAGSDSSKLPSVACSRVSEPPAPFDTITSQLSPRWPWTQSVPLLRHLVGRNRTVVHKEHVVERGSVHKAPRITPLRRILRLLAFSLMLL